MVQTQSQSMAYGREEDAYCEPLTDRYGRGHTYLRISVTDHCNLRCIYCMPPNGIRRVKFEHILTFDEIKHLVVLFAGMGIRKIRLTGGEPLLRQGMVNLIARLSALSGIEVVGMTSNGVLLKEHVSDLKNAGLTHLNISLDTLEPEKFERITSRNSLGRVLEGIDAAIETGFQSIKLNVVVMGGINDDELLNFIEFVRNRPVVLRFIEFMPSKSNRWCGAGFFSMSTMRSRVETNYPLIPLDEKEEGQITKLFRIEGIRGKIGFITPLSDPFCAHCNRLRLTANGYLRTCLFYPSEFSLRDEIRSGTSDRMLMKMIRRAVACKPQAHKPMEVLTNQIDRSMIEIGG